MQNIRRHALLLSTASLVACGGPAVAVATSSSPAAHPGAVSPTGTVRLAHLLVQQGDQPLAQLAMVDTTTGRSSKPVPAGVTTADLSRVYAVAGGATTTLTAFDAHTGAPLARGATDPGFALPRLGPSERPLGLSPNGRHLVLTDAPTSTAGTRSVSHFLVYDTSALAQPPQRIVLPGDFQYDGINNAGSSLYLLQQFPQSSGDYTAYHVRRYDLTTGALDPAIIADKRTGERSMSGTPTDTVTSRDGAWQYTVYAFGAGSPFVHALNLDEAASYCIDLPRAPLDQAMDLLWGLAASHDGHFVFAVNAGNGAVMRMPSARPWEVTPASFAVPRPQSTQSAWTPWAPVTAYAKRIAYGAAVISRDDRRLYSLGDLGIFALDTGTLALAGAPLLRTQPLTSLAMNERTGLLYATSLDSVTPLLQVDPRDGRWAPINAGRPVRVLSAGGS